MTLQNTLPLCANSQTASAHPDSNPNKWWWMVWVYTANNNNNWKWRIPWWWDLHHHVAQTALSPTQVSTRRQRGSQYPLSTKRTVFDKNHNFYSLQVASTTLFFSMGTSTFFFIFSFTYNVPLLFLWAYSSASTFSFTEPRSRIADTNVFYKKALLYLPLLKGQAHKIYTHLAFEGTPASWTSILLPKNAALPAIPRTKTGRS